ncbi:ribose ABC transporter permease [uncultured Microscilla sp.]|uniref:class I SAM-dependent methyltransferase n=1 Tax=uncultured Microscilla sp. TaxID=432653 RepID=UPI0026190B88|nr:ribose ABC transporter permease [uncultured Microscilla sp.]
MNRLQFFFEATKNIRQAGTITQSSRFLIRKMLLPIDFSEAKIIVELGAGNGCITKAILEKMQPDAKLLSFEVNPKFVDLLGEIKDERLQIIADSAENIPQHLAQHNATHTQAVVSGLPLAIFPKELNTNIMNAIKNTLTPDGVYTQFQYSLTSFGMLKKQFTSVRRDFTPLNIPPAFVYICRNS